MMIAPPRILIAFALAGASGSCARPSPQFSTIDRPPEPSQKDAVTHYEPNVSQAPPSQARFEELTHRFLLALSNHAPHELSSFLTNDAVVRRHPSTAGLAGLPELTQMMSAWGHDTLPGNGPPPPQGGFGPAQITAIEPDHSPPWAQVAVAGPPDVQGEWKLVFSARDGAPLIQEVVLPKSR